MGAENSFSRAVRIVRETGHALASCRERKAEIQRDTVEADHRLGGLEGALERDAARAALKGPLLDAKVTARRRAEIEEARAQLDALEAAKPMIATALNAAEREHEVAKRTLSALAIPHIHRELRLPAVAAIQAPLTALCNALAPIKAVDIVQRRLAGDQPFVRSIPERFFFGEELVDKLIAAIPPQFADKTALSLALDKMAKEIAEAEIRKLEKADG